MENLDKKNNFPQELKFNNENLIIIEKQIGSGQNTSVYLCKYLKDKIEMEVAVKMFNKQMYQQQDQYEQFKQEMSILQRLKSRHICKYLGFEQDAQNYYLIVEYCNDGDLFQKRRKEGYRIQIGEKNVYVFDEETALRYTKQILIAFRDMKTRDQDGKIYQVLHRDLKAQNIFLMREGNESIIKVGDFGFAKQLGENQFANTKKGSPYTMAPEVSAYSGYNNLCDVYSLGVVLYQMLFGCYPFQPTNLSELKQNDQTNLPEIIAEYARQNNPNFQVNNIEISPQVQTLLTQMLQVNANNRITFEQLFAHPLFSIQEIDDQQQQEATKDRRISQKFAMDQDSMQRQENYLQRSINRLIDSEQSIIQQEFQSIIAQEQSMVQREPKMNLQIIGENGSDRRTLAQILLQNDAFITLDYEVQQGGINQIQRHSSRLYVHYDNGETQSQFQQQLDQTMFIVIVFSLGGNSPDTRAEDILQNLIDQSDQIQQIQQDKCIVAVGNKRQTDKVSDKTLKLVEEHCLKNNYSFIAVDLQNHQHCVRVFILSQIRLHYLNYKKPQINLRNISFIQQQVQAEEKKSSCIC